MRRPQNQPPRTGILHYFGNNVGNKSVPHRGHALHTLRPYVPPQTVQHQSRVPIHPQRVVIRNSARLDRHRFMRQHRVNEDDGRGTGLRLSDRVRQQILRIGQIGRDDNFARRRKRRFDVALREGHTVTSQHASAG